MIIGLDLSLKRPAAVVIPDGWLLGEWESLEVWSELIPPVKQDDLEGQYRRLCHITDRVVSYCEIFEDAQVYVENYAFSMHSSSVTKLAELGGCVRADLFEKGFTLKPVVASSARKLLLGKLPKRDQKVAVQRALYAHGATFANDDECDAFVVANYGLSEMGHTALCLQSAAA